MFTLDVSLEGNYLGLIIYLSLPCQSHHADRAKKLHPDQGGPHSRIPVGFRNDLPDVERQKSKHEPLQQQAPMWLQVSSMHTTVSTPSLTRVQCASSCFHIVWSTEHMCRSQRSVLGIFLGALHLFFFETQLSNACFARVYICVPHACSTLEG